MESLVRRLRKHALLDSHDEREVLHAPLMYKAANEIERLQRELAECQIAFESGTRAVEENASLQRDLAAAKAVIENIVVSEVEPAQAEAERLRAENAELHAWVRVVMEETVVAGYSGGDRNQTLQNIRDMRSDAARKETK